MPSSRLTSSLRARRSWTLHMITPIRCAHGRSSTSRTVVDPISCERSRRRRKSWTTRDCPACCRSCAATTASTSPSSTEEAGVAIGVHRATSLVVNCSRSAESERGLKTPAKRVFVVRTERIEHHPAKEVIAQANPACTPRKAARTHVGRRLEPRRRASTQKWGLVLGTVLGL